jgi:glutamate synthase domain-containing protein 3
MVDLEPLDQSADVQLVGDLIDRHVTWTGSAYAAGILSKWRAMQARFVKVMPRDFKRVLAAEARARAEGREATFQELVGVGG